SSLFVQHVEGDLGRRTAFEESVHFVAKSEILSPLPDIESHLGIPLARVAAVELEDAIFQPQPAKRWREGGAIEHLQVQPPILNLFRRRIMKPPCVRACGLEGGGGSCLVVNLDQEDTPTSFVEFGGCRTGGHLNPHFRVDLDAVKAMGVEHLLEAA